MAKAKTRSKRKATIAIAALCLLVLLITVHRWEWRDSLTLRLVVVNDVRVETYRGALIFERMDMWDNSLSIRLERNTILGANLLDHYSYYGFYFGSLMPGWWIIGMPLWLFVALM